ncbi:hypothetical protein RF11_01338 [Thelohanellus kitauei]|uniref:Uncharacterized protein n=1 Tax=Thelohanellus kitauei TaxID=669202 RepID=A0A0C2N650_THEKT|nr:hypothetical protein RF11_01338 [Thelohanellus kitauei]
MSVEKRPLYLPPLAFHVLCMGTSVRIPEIIRVVDRKMLIVVPPVQCPVGTPAVRYDCCSRQDVFYYYRDNGVTVSLIHWYQKTLPTFPAISTKNRLTLHKPPAIVFV